MQDFNPEFPEVPSVEDIFTSLVSKYDDYGSVKVNFTDLHLRTKEASASFTDTVEFLNKREYKPRKDLDSIFLARPIRWDMDPFEDTNWCLHLNSLRLLDRYYNNYDKKRDAEFLDFPLSIIKDWTNYHISINDTDLLKSHFFMTDDMTCGIRQLRIAYLVDKYMAGIYEIESSVLEQLAKTIHFHWTNLAHPKNFKSTNHTISVVHALMSLLITTDIKSSLYSEWHLSILTCFEHLVHSQFDKRGIHIENSPEYHFFVLRLFDELYKSEWYDGVKQETKQVLKLAHSSGDWMKLPDGRVLSIGDSNAKPPMINRNTIINSYALKKNRDIESFIHPLYSFFRVINATEQWSFLAIKSGHMIETHRHKDDLSFLWSESGIDIVVDAGKYAYTRDKYRQYIKSLRAHNTLLFTKRYFSKGREKEKEYDFMPDNSIPIYKHTEYGVYLEINKKIKDSDLIVIRKFYFSPRQWLVICDEVNKSDELIETTSHLHFAPEFKWDMNSDIKAKNEYLLTDKYNNLYTKVATNKTINIMVSDGGELEPSLNGFVSREYKKVETAPFMSIAGYGNIKVAVAISLNNNENNLSFDNDTLVWSVNDIAYILE